jgi:hypothetical protein
LFVGGGPVKLFVDDLRTPPSGWRLARTVEEARRCLDTEIVEEVSLDYFIGNGEGGTFLPVARHIAGLAPERRPKRVRLHTASDAGAARLAAALDGLVEIERV